MAPRSRVKEKQRAMKAVKEMKSCGFPAEKTKSVMKELLKSFDNNWDLIENENYSVLVDALISSDDDNGQCEKARSQEGDTVANDDVGADFCRKKRLKHISDDNPVFDSGAGNVLVRESIPSTFSCRKGKEPALDYDDATGVGSPMPKKVSLEMEKMNAVNKGLVQFEEPKRNFINNPETDEKSSDGGGSGSSHPIDHRLAVILPESIDRPRLSINGFSESVGGTIVRAKSTAKSKTTNHASRTNKHTQCYENNQSGISGSTFGNRLKIASSSNGKVKLLLSWDIIEGNFQTPNIEAIMKMVEDKWLKSYKLLQPNFSVLDIMTRVCQAAEEFSKNTDDRSPVNGTSNKEIACLLPNISSFCMIAVRQQVSSSIDPKPVHDVNDITKGQETVKISLANDDGNANFPPSFFYISQNMVYQNGHMNFSLARIGDEDCCSDCFKDCLSASLPCACARETGGEFAYNIDGLLKEKFLDDYISSVHNPQNHHFTYCKDCPLERLKNEDAPDPCKGHIVRKFIKECWVKCGCDKQCGNRVVQRGIIRSLQVFFTGDSKGWGLRTLEELPRGAFVCEYIGEVLTNLELYDRTLRITGNAAHTYPVLLDADWGSEGILKDEEALCLDATFYGNVARFINHRCYDANLMEIPVEIETADRHYYHLAFFTTRKIEALEELTWDYGIDFDDRSHPVKSFKCKCGGKYCRDMKKSARSRSKALVLR